MDYNDIRDLYEEYDEYDETPYPKRRGNRALGDYEQEDDEFYD